MFPLFPSLLVSCSFIPLLVECTIAPLPQSHCPPPHHLFHVGHVHRLLCRGNCTERVGAGAPVYLAAVLEYLSAEILELAGKVARDNKKTCIIPHHLQLTVHNDE
uniref:Histone H2A n=1 Tax=Eptatretus burgeri TaxID=7764 RepID=A0A8C4QXT2_EPTBU